jgi:MoxR-like ATPase
MTDPSSLYDAIEAEVGRVIVGNEDVFEGLTVAILIRRHVLLEGVPGVAKTTIANLFARSLGLDKRRIQMTPDILPADITGTNVYRENVGEFELQKGPIFTNVVVADEINRATPKTQSALLEAMQEGAVTIEGGTRSLPQPFMVVATQNPIEMEGTHELPEAQRDRFAFKLQVALPDADDEMTILDRFDEDPELGPDAVQEALGTDDFVAARKQVAAVHVDRSVKQYILDLVGETRSHPDVAHGGSPRASLTLQDGAKAVAALDGREYVIPDDVKRLAKPTLIHRLVLDTEAELADVTAEEVIDEILETVAPPSGLNADSVPVSSDGGEQK